MSLVKIQPEHLVVSIEIQCNKDLSYLTKGNSYTVTRTTDDTLFILDDDGDDYEIAKDDHNFSIDIFSSYNGDLLNVYSELSKFNEQYNKALVISDVVAEREDDWDSSSQDC